MRLAARLLILLVVVCGRAHAQTPSSAPASSPAASASPAASVSPTASASATASPSPAASLSPAASPAPSQATPAAATPASPSPSASASASPRASPREFPATPLIPKTTPTPTPLRPPSAPVILNGIELINVYGSGDLNAQERAKVLEDRINDALSKTVEMPDITVRMVGASPVLECGGIQLMTVTDQDAAAEGQPKSIGAVNYRTQLERRLSRVWSERSGLFLSAAFRNVAIAIVIGILLHIGAGWLARRFLNTPGWLLKGLIWLVVFSIGLLSFPATRGIGVAVRRWLVLPTFKVLVVAIGGLLLWLIGNAVIARYFRVLLAMRTSTGRADNRAPQRLVAAQQATRVVLDVLITVLVLTGMFGAFSINATALLASAGIIGVALGVSAQDLLRDFVAGLAILLEDQFGVGDWIKSANISGEVVGFNLRSTRVRNSEGSLITVPNSMLRVVENQSNEWSQADVAVRVSPGTSNVSRALELMKRAGIELHEAAPEDVIEVPKVLGIERMSPTGVTLRMLVKTGPSRQWQVRRDMLERIAVLFEAEGIETPRPSWMQKDTKDPERLS